MTSSPSNFRSDSCAFWLLCQSRTAWSLVCGRRSGTLGPPAEEASGCCCVYWKKSNVDVGGPCPWSLLPLFPLLKNEPVAGMFPTAAAFFDRTGELSLEWLTYGVEWFPRRISSDRELDAAEGAFVTARVRGSTKMGVCGGSGSPWYESSSDDESRSSMAFGWLWRTSKNDGGEDGAGADRIDWCVFDCGICRTSGVVPLRSETGNGGVLGPGSSISESSPLEGNGGTRGVMREAFIRCAREDDRGGGGSGVR